MTRYTDRYSDHYTDRTHGSIGLAHCSQRVESREQRVEGREQRVEEPLTWFIAAAGATRPCLRDPYPSSIGGYETNSSQVGNPRPRAGVVQ